MGVLHRSTTLPAGKSGFWRFGGARVAATVLLLEYCTQVAARPLWYGEVVVEVDIIHRPRPDQEQVEGGCLVVIADLLEYSVVFHPGGRLADCVCS